MSLLPTRIWLYISFSPPQNQTTDTLRRTGWASMPGPVIIEQNLASGASCESDGRCQRPAFVILDQAIIGKSGAEGDFLDSVRQTLDRRSPSSCPSFLGLRRQTGQNDCQTGKRISAALVQRAIGGGPAAAG